MQNNLQFSLLLLLWGLSLIRIFQLKRTLRHERLRANVPLLNFRLDTHAPIFALVNEGSCTAKDIHIDDVRINLDYDFKKTLRLVFQDIPEIHPSQKKDLEFRLFEGEYELSKEVGDSFFAHLQTATFTAQCRCQNFAGIAFVATIVKDDRGVRLNAVQPV